MKNNVPIFPLSSITFPGGYMPLRIFETGFGISLNKPNSNEFYDVGTYCKIADWEQLDDGLLGITALGKYRYRVINSSIQPDNLIVADIESMIEPNFIDIPKDLMPYSDFLKNILEQYPKFYHDDAPKYTKLKIILIQKKLFNLNFFMNFFKYLFRSIYGVIDIFFRVFT